MRIFRSLLSTSLLLALLGATATVHAQIPQAEIERRISKFQAQLQQGNEDEQSAALFQLAQLALSPEQGIPLFRAHLQRKTKSAAEAMAVAHAIEGLAPYGKDARAALTDLIRLLDEVGTVEGEKTNGAQTWWWLLNTLPKIGPDDPSVAEAMKRTLRRCLESPERLHTLAGETALALSHMGRTAHTAVPLLTQTLSRLPGETSEVAWTLSRMMPEAVIAVPALTRALEEGHTPEKVAEALGLMGPAAKSALPTLQRILALPSPALAANSFAAIARIEGLPTLTLPEARTILEQIEKRRLAETYAAFATIKLAGPKATAAVPALTQIVANRKEPWLRRTAIDVLAVVGPNGNTEAQRLLIQAVRRTDPVIEMDADKAFQEFGFASAEVTPELSDLLAIDDSRIWQKVITLLNQAGPLLAPAVPNLVRLLPPPAQRKRMAGSLADIVHLLARLGPQAQESVPALTDLLLDPDNDNNITPYYDRTTLLVAVMKIGITPRVLPAVRKMLASPHQTEVAAAAHAVALLGTDARDTIPLLLRPLQPDYKDSSMTWDFFYGYSYDTSARIESIRALAQFGPAAKEAVPLLQPFADAPEDPIKRSFRQLILKQEAQQAIQAIQQTKKSECPGPLRIPLPN